jgi:hypothetical protein
MLPLLVLVALLGTGYALSRSEATADAPRTAMHGTAPVVAAPYRPPDLVAQAARGEQARAVAHLPSGGTAFSELRGRHVPVEELEHGNMQPHYRGAPPTAPKSPPALLERYTGSGPRIARSSVPPMFTPVVQRPGPMASANDWAQTRLQSTVSRTHQGEAPFQAQRVAPLLGGGYGDKGTGGYHQLSTQEIVRPRTSDQLRAGGQTRSTLEGRANAGRAVNPLGAQGPDCVSKHGPATAFERSAADLLPSGATVTRARMDGAQIMPSTDRGVARADLIGGAAQARGGGYSVEEQALRYKQPGLAGENIGIATRSGMALVDPPTYAALLKDNEREGLPTPALGGAAPSAGGHGEGRRALVTERPGIRALTTAHPRMNGNVQHVVPTKLTMYDPNEIARTTIKETLIHDTRTGGAGPAQPQRALARQPGASLDLTTRNTLPAIQGARGDGRMDGTAAVYKAPVYDPNDIPRTTDRETFSVEQRKGGVATLEAGTGYATAPRDVSNTQRQFTSDADYVGAVSGQGRDGYKVAAADVPYTQRHELNDTQYTGAAGLTTTKAQMSYAQAYARAMDDVREMTLVGRDPTQNGPKVAVGKDSIHAAAGKRDPRLDVATERSAYERQGAVQAYAPEDCAKDTRAPLEVHASRSPDLDMLTQLQGNPYAQRIANAL